MSCYIIGPSSSHHLSSAVVMVRHGCAAVCLIKVPLRQSAAWTGKTIRSLGLPEAARFSDRPPRHGPGGQPTLSEQLGACSIEELSKRVAVLSSSNGPEMSRVAGDTATGTAGYASNCDRLMPRGKRLRMDVQLPAAPADSDDASCQIEFPSAAKGNPAVVDDDDTMAAKTALLNTLVASFAPAPLFEEVPNHTHGNLGFRKVVFKAGAPVPPAMLERLYAALDNLAWPARRQRKALASEQYMTIGAPPKDADLTKLSRAARKAAKRFEEYAPVWRTAKEIVENIDAAYTYTNIAVTKNFVGSPHRDEFVSALLSFLSILGGPPAAKMA